MEFPTVEISASERREGVLEPGTLERASELFERWGSVRLLHVFDPDFVRALAEHYRRRYWAKLIETAKPDGRPLFTPSIEGPFADARYLTPPMVWPLVKRALGDDCVLGAFGSVVSFPGAPDQFVHRDSESLYDDYSVDVRLPPYALTVLFPLVDADDETGATRVWPGTHRVPSFEEAQRMPSASPELPAGSALMTDSRTLHGGSANRSRNVRPVVYNAYHRSWYRDRGGYEDRPPVHLGIVDQLRLPAERRPMFRIPVESSSLDRFIWEAKRLTARVKSSDSLRRLKQLVPMRGAR